MTESGRVRAGTCLTMLLLALSALLWGGCSTPARTSQARLEAIKHNQKGVAAELRGNQSAALEEFTEALRLHGSIENWEGMVVAQINIARTQRLRGELKSARGAVDRALSLLPESSDLAPELFFENAKIHLAAGELAAAKDWALKAAAAEKGDDLGRRLNLVCAILFRSGAPEQAREQAEMALKLNRDKAVPSEEANSLRLLGELHLAQGRADQAADCFDKSLVLDKKLGLGKKVALDLRGLGAAAAHKEDLSAARALEVSRNGRDTAAVADDMAKLAELLRKSGESQLALQMEQERTKLVKSLKGPEKQPQ